MSLWTPSGEHPVDRPGRSGSSPGPAGPVGQRPAAEAPGGAAPVGTEELTPEERAQLDEMSQQVEEARRQLVQAPAGPVVGQQALQFYELAALHLSEPEPKLDDARIAIDALAAVVEKLGPRLGQAETPLRQALNQVQLAFVEASRSSGEPSSAQPTGADG